MIEDKNKARKHRKIRIRKKISGSPERPRMVVFRSNNHIYVQLVDDTKGQTLLSASTLAMSRIDSAIRGNKDGCEKVGQEIAKLAKEKNIVNVVFDRNGYIYHGRIKAVAEGARKGGLEF